MSTRLIDYRTNVRAQLRKQHAKGEVARLRRGIYSASDNQLAQVEAAAVRLGAVASHETAAALWGLPFLGRPTTLHMTRERRNQGTARYDAVVVHHAKLNQVHVTTSHGIAVTTPARTVFDLARARQFRAGVVVADAALRARLCTREDLQEVAAACRRWPGVAAGRRVADFANARAGSPLESISRVAFHDWGLPRPILQAVIGGLDEVDFLWSDYRIIGEADGLGKYTSPDVLYREKLREDGIAQLGFAVFRWTWSEAYQRPDALAHRAWMLLTRHGYRP